MRKWFLLTSVAAVAMAVILARYSSAPREELSFRFVDAITGRQLPHASASITEIRVPYFVAVEKALEKIGLALSRGNTRDYSCTDDGLLRLRLKQHRRFYTFFSCACADHVTATIAYYNGTTRVAPLVPSKTGLVGWPVLLPANGIVTVPLDPYVDSLH